MTPLMEQPRNMRRPFRVVIIGGGITGLTASYTLTRAASDVIVTVLEASSRLGGNIRTERVDDFVLDTGPDSFLVTKPDALSLCKDLGLANRLIETRPEARRVYFVHEGRLEPMPAGMTLSVPTRIEPLITTRLLTTAGKLRALAEPFIPAKKAPATGNGGIDESIEQFFTRRFGKEVATRLAGPLLGGVYAGDTSTLSMEATFPQLTDLERRHGSLVRGFFAAVKDRRSLLEWLTRPSETSAASPFRSLDDGMGTLIDALVSALPPGIVHRGTPVSSIRRSDSASWQVVTDDRSFDADAVLIAVPARIAAELVPDATLARELGSIPYVSTATVFYAFKRGDVGHPLDGLGFIAPPGEAEILAGTWVSSKWNGRAPRDTVLMRAFVGGARGGKWVEAANDDELVELAARELRRIMGSLGEPLWTRLFRYHRASPQPVIGHLDRLRRIESRMSTLSGLYIAGAALDGVGIPDCVRQARAAARRILEQSANIESRRMPAGEQRAAR